LALVFRREHWGRMNQLKVNQQQSILILHQRGWSKRRIARELALDRATVRKYLVRAVAKPATNPHPGSDTDATSKSPGHPHIGSASEPAAKPPTHPHTGSAGRSGPASAPPPEPSSTVSCQQFSL